MLMVGDKKPLSLIDGKKKCSWKFMKKPPNIVKTKKKIDFFI